MYTLTHHAYCGMRITLLETADQADQGTARTRAAARIRSARRRGFPVAILERGAQWEVMEPENCGMVPDACGVLALRRVIFECRECGCAHDSRDDAAACCTDEDWQDTEEE